MDLLKMQSILKMVISDCHVSLLTGVYMGCPRLKMSEAPVLRIKKVVNLSETYGILLGLLTFEMRPIEVGMSFASLVHNRQQSAA